MLAASRGFGLYDTLVLHNVNLKGMWSLGQGKSLNANSCAVVSKDICKILYKVIIPNRQRQVHRHMVLFVLLCFGGGGSGSYVELFAFNPSTV